MMGVGSPVTHRALCRLGRTSAGMPAVAQLTALLADGTADPVVMRSLGELLEVHVRREERQLFPLIERLLTDETLDGLSLAETETGGSQGSGPIWGTASEELNATLLSWNAGEVRPSTSTRNETCC